MLRTRLQTCFSIHIVPNCVACFFLSDLAFVRDWLMMVQSCSINGKLWVSIGTHFHQVPLDFWPPEVSQTGKWFWQTLGSQIRNGLRWEWLQIMCQAYPTWVFQYISIAKNFMVVRNWSPTKRMKCKCVCVCWILVASHMGLHLSKFKSGSHSCEQTHLSRQKKGVGRLGHPCVNSFELYITYPTDSYSINMSDCCKSINWFPIMFYFDSVAGVNCSTCWAFSFECGILNN